MREGERRWEGRRGEGRREVEKGEEEGQKGCERKERGCLQGRKYEERLIDVTFVLHLRFVTEWWRL